MAPIHLQPLLWIYCRCSPISPDICATGAPQDLVERGYIEPVIDNGSGYTLTAKGKCFIEAVLAVPEPVQQWIIPNEAA